MITNSRTKIIAVVGMAGAGKSSAVDYLKQKQLPAVYFGGVIYDAMKEAGIEITPKNQADFREQIRQQEGQDFVVKRIIKQINDLVEAGQHKIIADGLYSWTEFKALKHAFPGQLLVIAILAPRHLRHARLANRPERPFNETEATERDWREIENLEKGGPIAMADFFISNDGTLEDLQQQIEQILAKIEFSKN